MKNQSLVLYVKYSCPFCKKVLNHMKDNEIDIEIRDVNDSTHKEYLIENGGKGQVPCLFIDGSALYESSDIINWLDNNY